jgi:hypothetical protein
MICNFISCIQIKEGLSDMVARVNGDLARISSWSLESSLILNPGKS